MVREPVDWYSSWINYTFNGPRDPLTHVLWSSSKTPKKFIENSMNLTEFFSDDRNILALKKYAARNPGSHVHNFIINYKELEPSYFNNQSLYGFYIFNQLKPGVKLFRFKEELLLMLKEFGFDGTQLDQKLPTVNITNYKAYSLTSDDKKLILTNEQRISEIYETRIFK
jgi:hypothetical protein